MSCQGKCCCKPDPELQRFRKAVRDCELFLLENIGSGCSIRLYVGAENGRITYLEKNLNNADVKRHT